MPRTISYPDLSTMTVLEAADLARALEEKWGVSAGAAVNRPNVLQVSEVEGKQVDIVLTGDGGKKINVIKEVRAITGLGLSDSKYLVESVPSRIKESVSKSEAAEIKRKIEQAGGTVRLMAGSSEVVDDIGDEISEDEFYRDIVDSVRQYIESTLGSPQTHLDYVRLRIRKALEPASV